MGVTDVWQADGKVIKCVVTLPRIYPINDLVENLDNSGIESSEARYKSGESVGLEDYTGMEEKT